MESEIESPATDDRSSIRVQAVLALLRGKHAGQVSAQFAICRSDLYKFRKRALDAMREALGDEKKGLKTPHNRLDAQKEEAIRSVCERQPILSSYEVRDRLQAEAPSVRTIQRVRNRLDLSRLNKRDTPSLSPRLGLAESARAEH